MTDRKKGRPPRKLSSGLFKTRPTLHGVQDFSDSQELPSLLWYLKVHDSVHNSLPLEDIKSQMNQGFFTCTLQESKYAYNLRPQTADIL
jgi:hypothetical protein